MATNRRVHLTDDSGRTVHDPTHAAAAEIVEELDDGTPVARTYLSRSPNLGAGETPPSVQYGNLPDPVEIHDELTAPELLNKKTWDVWLNIDGDFTLAETLEEVLQALEGDLSGMTKREFVANLVVLPAFEHAPEQLRRQAFAYLDSTRTGGPGTGIGDTGAGDPQAGNQPVGDDAAAPPNPDAAPDAQA